MTKFDDKTILKIYMEILHLQAPTLHHPHQQTGTQTRGSGGLEATV